MRKPPQKVRQRSIEWIERDVPSMGEVKFWQNFRLSRAEGLFPAIAAGVKREHEQESLKDSSNGGRPFSSPEPVVSWSRRLQIKLSGPGDENGGRRQCLSAFIRGVRVLCKPRRFLNSSMYVTLIYFRLEMNKLLCTISLIISPICSFSLLF